MVVMEHPKRPGFEVVKRIAALPGERVEDRVLQADQYWVTGDRPDASTDSRSFGPIHRSAIAGVIRLRYWPLSRLGAVS